MFSRLTNGEEWTKDTVLEGLYSFESFCEPVLLSHLLSGRKSQRLWSQGLGHGGNSSPGGIISLC